MNATSIRLSRLLVATLSVRISTSRDHTEVASFENVEVRPPAETMDPHSPKERFDRISPTSVSTKAVQPALGTAIIAKPAGNELPESCVATPRNVDILDDVKSDARRPTPVATKSPFWKAPAAALVTPLRINSHSPRAGVIPRGMSCPPLSLLLLDRAADRDLFALRRCEARVRAGLRLAQPHKR